MILTRNQIKSLKPFFLNELPPYIEKKVMALHDDKKYDDLLNNARKRNNKIYTKTSRPFCRSISSVVVVCLRHYGFKNLSVRNIQFMLGNKKARDILDKYGMDGLVEVVKDIEGSKRDDGVYTLGGGYGGDFHSVALINDTILDMTADQMNRKERGIIMKNYWLRTKDIERFIESMIYFAIGQNEVKPNGLIFTHPKLKAILNVVCKGIAQSLEIKYIPMKNISNYKKDKEQFNIARDKY